MSASLQAAQIIKCTFASISCLASAFIVFMILTEPKTGLTSPYSRIIFAMSISDILLSFSKIVSPFASPKDNPDALFAHGTFASCEVFGFLHLFAISELVLYTVFLAYYYLKRIRYKVTPQDFAKREEKYFHIIFGIISFGWAIACLAMENINPVSYGSQCAVASYPENCERGANLYVICERGGPKQTQILMMYSGVVACSSFLSLIVVFVLSIAHVYRIEKTLSIPARGIGASQTRNTSSRHHDGNDDDNHEQNEQDDALVLEERKAQNRMILTKQAFLQSFLYVLAFFLVYLGPVIHIFQIILGKSNSETEWRFWLVSTVSSLGGVFNILIYTRPKVLKLQETFPTLNYLELLSIIVVSGGEIPSMADVREALQALEDDDDGLSFDDDDGLSFDDDIAQENSNKLSYDLDISIASEFIRSRYSNL